MNVDEGLSDDAELLFIAGFRREVAVMVDAIALTRHGSMDGIPLVLQETIALRQKSSLGEKSSLDEVDSKVEIFNQFCKERCESLDQRLQDLYRRSGRENVSVSSSEQTEILTALGFDERACGILKLPQKNKMRLSLVDWLQNYVFSVWIRVDEIYPLTTATTQTKDEM